MHRARAARPRAFDSLPSQDPNPGRCNSYINIGGSMYSEGTFFMFFS
jgi:hypothetical protein